MNSAAFSKVMLAMLQKDVVQEYSASHSRVAPENVGLQKEQKYNTFAFGLHLHVISV
jgi:hypothetical protein